MRGAGRSLPVNLESAKIPHAWSLTQDQPMLTLHASIADARALRRGPRHRGDRMRELRR